MSMRKCLTAALFGHFCSALSRNKPRPLKKVAIIGSGIAGLASAHALSSLLPDLEISIFDDRPNLDPLVGAGIQLNGGLKVLGDINPRVQKAVISAGLPLRRLRTRTRRGNKLKDEGNQGGTLETLLDLNLQEIVQNSGATELLQSDGKILWTSIMRGTLQKTLFDTLEKKMQRRVIFNKKLTNLGVELNQQVYCSFSDGSKVGPFDLVVGCDGIKSVVKEYVDNGCISDESARSKISKTGLYTGIRIRYAVQMKAAKMSPSTLPVTFSQYFGNGCYCLDGTYGGASKTVTKSVFAIFLDENYFGPFRRRKESQAVYEDADWSQDKAKATTRARHVMMHQLQDANLSENDLLATVQRADQFFELGVYAHNPFCRWSKEVSGSDGAFVVLCGDAAHALPPFLGQGSNQAIQDAYSLAKRLRSYNEAVAERDVSVVSLAKYLDEYESARWMPNFQIFWKASLLGYLETGGYNGFYSSFRNIFFRTMSAIGVAQRVLLSAAAPKT
ncbi:hypothetical protein MPSEU_000657100 [Mayamaea pseudoterrestris]|nr:hypothetical protein MPSEU_000657100 [Mayamaea pseudoterrestris]